MNLESLRGFDLDLPAILELFPPEKVIKIIGLEKFIETIGAETVIQHLNTSDLVKLLAATLSDQEREAFIEQLRQLNENDNWNPWENLQFPKHLVQSMCPI